MSVTQKFSVNKEKQDFQAESEKLVARLIDPFNKFLGDSECGSSVTVTSKRVMWDKKLHGYNFREDINLWEKYNSLVNLHISRYHHYSLDDHEYSGADSCYKITLYYHDNCDCLTYSDEYYPDMTNDMIYDKVCQLFETGINMCKLDVEHREK